MSKFHEHDGDLEALFLQFKQAKAFELEAKEIRIECEEQIAELIDGPESGTKTVLLKSGKRITVKRGVRYSADIDKIAKIDIPDFHPPLQSKTTVMLDANGYEWYRDNDPTAFTRISEFVKTKPQKVAVTIKEGGAD